MMIISLKKWFFLIIVLINISFSISWRNFHRGRSAGGNLGLPNKTNSSYYHFLVDEKWFLQKLDHYNPLDNRIWKQRYFLNDAFKKTENTPVFLMIGGEGEASSKWMEEGAWIHYAKRFGAICFQLEHRYYGESRPTEDLSTKNLEYLSSEQALADLANFIESMNRLHKFPNGTKWIVFGGSYPGSLAAWMRLKYPHLVHGAMSASGPLLAKVDFKEYFQVVSNDLANHSQKCVKSVKEGTEQVGMLLKNRYGQNQLNLLFSLCDPIEDSIDNPKDISNFYQSLANNFAEVAQYNDDNRRSSNRNEEVINLRLLCDIMENETIGPPVFRLAAVNHLILKDSLEICLDYIYDSMIEEMKNTSWLSSVSEGGRQWMYQTCTEFGFYQTSSQSPHVFGHNFPVDVYIEECIDIFGVEFNSSFLNTETDRTNMFYGALDLEAGNIVFVQGSVDPWHALGIIETRNDASPAIFIEGTAHCANMYEPSKDDLPQLTASRRQIEDLIEKWLSE